MQILKQDPEIGYIFEEAIIETNHPEYLSCKNNNLRQVVSDSRGPSFDNPEFYPGKNYKDIVEDGIELNLNLENGAGSIHKRKVLETMQILLKYKDRLPELFKKDIFFSLKYLLTDEEFKRIYEKYPELNETIDKEEMLGLDKNVRFNYEESVQDYVPSLNYRFSNLDPMSGVFHYEKTATVLPVSVLEDLKDGLAQD